jgi:hypothetical protein
MGDMTQRTIAAELESLLADVSQADLLEYLGKRNPPPAWAEAEAGKQADDDLDLDLDSYPMGREGPHGWWVSAWVWVDQPLRSCDCCGVEFPRKKLKVLHGRMECATCRNMTHEERVEAGYEDEGEPNDDEP